MKECMVLHINDGGAVTLGNADHFFAEHFPKAEFLLNDLLNQGYEIKHMIPQISPAEQREGNFTFYKSGFIVYLEREKPTE